MTGRFPFSSIDRRSSRRLHSRLTAGPAGLSAEALEDKTLLTVYTVNTTTDSTVDVNSNSDGLISLREAIEAANNNAAFGDAPAGTGAGTDIINFAPSLRGQTINISGDDFDIAGDLTINGVIDGIATNLPRINANLNSRHFDIFSGNVSISGLWLFSGNGTDLGTGTQQGGSIRHTGGNLTLSSMWLHGNHAPSGSGGGVFSGAGTIDIIGSTFSNNSASGGGGLFLATSGNLVNSTVSGNSSFGFAGGIRVVSNGNIEMNNSTITGNRSDAQGGTGQRGGGIGIDNTGQVNANNTLIAGNFRDTGTTADDVFKAADSFFTGFNNLIGDASTSGGLTDGTFENIVGLNGSGTRDINTILNTTLQNNGGTWPTHALLESSIAVNNGDNQRAKDGNGAFLTTDGRGAPFTRFGAGTGNAFTFTDIGAFELQPRFAVNTLLDETNDPTTFSLREAILTANAQNIGSNVGGSTDEILFSSTLDGGTITLNGTQLPAMTGKTSIQGRGADLLTISGNNASRIFEIQSGATASISGLTLTGGNSDSNGGSIYSRGTLSLDAVVISGNSATTTGGGIFSIGSTQIVNSTISGNSAGGNGGGIGSFNNLTVTNSTISGNSAGANGGGIYNNLLSTTIINSTITGNRANSDNFIYGETGGGIWTFYDGDASTKLQNSIVAGNFVGTGNVADDVNNKPLEAGSNFNLIGDAATAGGLTNGTNGNIVGVNVHDVLDTTLRNNGGPTPTHALIPNSPAINRGSNALAVDASMAALTTDQRGTGFNRIVGGRVDIGAFEGFLDPVTSLVGFVNGNWWISYPLANGEYDNSVAANGPASTFQKVLTGDFNGDGHDDLAAWLFNGDWRVGLSDGMGHFTFTTWTTWTVPGIKEIHVGDFNDDGKDDIIGLFPIPGGNRGRWWVGQSNGTQFQNRNWGDFGNFTGILDVAVGNFDGVKGDDLTIITTTGNIFMVKTSNTRFQYLFSHNWVVNSGFNFFQAGDFNGDGRDDIVAVFGNGANRSVFVAKSTGPATSFASLKFSNLTASQSLDSFLVGDFNGDGKDDVAARLNTTKWWLGLAGTNIFNFTFGTTWSFATNGVNDIHVGSTNGDGNSDILGRDNSGNWYSAESNGTSLTNRVAEMWAPVNWQFVNGGDFQPKATSDEIVIPPAQTKQEAEETTTPDIAGRWIGATETTSSAPSATTQAASLLKPADEEEESSADYDSFGDASLLDLLYS